MSNTFTKAVVREFKDMVGIFVYLFFIFSAFITYRHLVMAELGVEYNEIGFALIKALVFAKVILIIKFLTLVKQFDDKPLVVPVAYKTFLFTLLSAVFIILEHIVRGLINGLDVAGAFHEILSIGTNELLSRVLVFVFALIPYFIMNEVSRVVGKGKVLSWFFRREHTDLTPGE
ncbi:MAG: hypothetical protein NTX15_00360 [Candidatus Kapabacteria bacterium]|nr:hypothetical protein [Candidatus Kapabacteria bacterium]